MDFDQVSAESIQSGAKDFALIVEHFEQLL